MAKRHVEIIKKQLYKDYLDELDHQIDLSGDNIVLLKKFVHGKDQGIYAGEVFALSLYDSAKDQYFMLNVGFGNSETNMIKGDDILHKGTIRKRLSRRKKNTYHLEDFSDDPEMVDACGDIPLSFLKHKLKMLSLTNFTIRMTTDEHWDEVLGLTFKDEADDALFLFHFARSIK